MSNQKRNTFYFNTGCKPHNSPAVIPGHVWKGGTRQIPFECDAPKDALLKFCCDIPNLPESKSEHIIVREMFNTVMVSKYAYLMVTAEEKRNLEQGNLEQSAAKVI